MKISETTLNILKNFSTINPNLYVPAGSKLKTLATSRSFLAEANVEEEFPIDFGIYDLGKLLQLVSMFNINDIEWTFDNESLTIDVGTEKIQYFYADPDTMVYSVNDLKLPDFGIEVSLSEENLKRMSKAASVLGIDTVAIRGNADGVFLSAVDQEGATKNTYNMKLADDAEGKEFDILYDIKHFRFLSGNYDVSIAKTLSRFKLTNGNVVYYCSNEDGGSYVV